MFMLVGLYVVSDGYVAVQWQLIMYLNLAYGLYLGAVMPWSRPIYNKIEIMNELFTAFATMQLVLFTDFVMDVELRASLGWMLVGTITLFFVINMYFIMQDASHMVWLLC